MKLYYFINKERMRQGPLPLEDLTPNDISPDTLVWCKGMEKWLKAKDVDDFKSLLLTDAIDNKSSSQPDETNLTLIKCKECGQMISAKAEKCPKCGKSVNEEPSSELYEEEVSSSGFKKYLPFALGAIVALGIVGYFFFSHSSNNYPNEDESTNTIAIESISTDVTSTDQSLKEEIIRSLEELFDDVMRGDIHTYNNKYFSSEFNRIYNEVDDIDKRLAEEGYIGFWDFGFWDMAQDDVKMNIALNDVYNIKENEAMAKVMFKIGSGDFSETKNEDIKVILENGKWVLDDVHGYKKQMTEYVEENSRHRTSDNIENNIPLINNTEEYQNEVVAEIPPVLKKEEPQIKVKEEREIEVEDEDETIYQVVENQPEFPGGTAALMQFLSKNVKYPENSQENGVQGRVIVQFVVNKDGTIVDPVVSRSVDPYLDKEAIRVVSSMPKWKPGMQRGKPVRVRYTLPVAFKLQ